MQRKGIRAVPKLCHTRNPIIMKSTDRYPQAWSHGFISRRRTKEAMSFGFSHGSSEIQTGCKLGILSLDLSTSSSYSFSGPILVCRPRQQFCSQRRKQSVNTNQLNNVAVGQLLCRDCLHAYVCVCVCGAVYADG